MKLALSGVIFFLLGAVPLLALTFFSPGLGSEGYAGALILLFGIITLGLLFKAAQQYKWIWILVGIRCVLIGLVLYETLSGGRLYMGT
ncbi:MAG: hypothetical protein ACHP78_00480 [Terriglobales bacterium]